MAHLREFMRNGREFTVAVLDPDSGEAVDVPVWIQRPSTLQHDMAVTKANASASKHRAAYRNPDTEEHQALMGQLEDMETDDLIDIITRKERAELSRQANEEVLYGEDWGSKWDGVDEETGEGNDYIAIVEALAEKYIEYQKLAAEGIDIGDVTEDPEVKHLMALQQQFESEVDQRVKELTQSLDSPLRKKSKEDLVDLAFKELVASNARMEWYRIYRMWILYFACRYPDDHKKLYFDSIDELYDLDEAVRTALLLYYDEVDKGPDNTKVSPTPVDSSPSSEQ